jgi:8-oxo-dGTP pyrophosphatase MutT (NUDIX family)
MAKKIDPCITSLNGRTFATFPVAVLGYVVDKSGQFLLMRRPTGLKWEIPSGVLERGEAPLDGIYRELREELGADAVVDVLGLVHAVQINFDERINSLISLGFLVHHKTGDIVPGDDMAGAEFSWHCLEELLTRADIEVPNDLDHFRTAYNLYLCRRQQF